VTDPRSLNRCLDQLRDRGLAQVWILAGDGTIHALAQYLAASSKGWDPALLLLAGGRANVVPRETGGYPALAALRSALAALRDGRPLHEEPLFTLQVSQPGSPKHQGFVFAGALVYEAIRMAAAYRASGTGWRHRSWFADPYSFLRWSMQTVVVRRPLPTYAASALMDGRTLAGPMRMLIASTLSMRTALYNPFAARGRGPLRFTAIASSAPSTWKLMPALLKGRFAIHHDAANGILSGRCERAELMGVGNFALDGELFNADPALPLVLTAGAALRALRPEP
jgi:hypothetical protein